MKPRLVMCPGCGEPVGFTVEPSGPYGADEWHGYCVNDECPVDEVYASDLRLADQ